MTSDPAGDAHFKARAVTRPRAQVEEQIKEAILLGQFAQGEKLPPETVLAEQFGVSRPTVREALAALVSAGLIRKIPGVAGGSFVNTVTPGVAEPSRSASRWTRSCGSARCEIAELTQVRRMLEVPAARYGGGEPHRRPPRRRCGRSSTGSAPRRSTTRTSRPTTCSSTRRSGTRREQAAGGVRRLAARRDASGPVPRGHTGGREPHGQAAHRHPEGHRDGDADGPPQAMDEHLAYVLRYSIDSRGGGP